MGATTPHIQAARLLETKPDLVLLHVYRDPGS